MKKAILPLIKFTDTKALRMLDGKLCLISCDLTRANFPDVGCLDTSGVDKVAMRDGTKWIGHFAEEEGVWLFAIHSNTKQTVVLAEGKL